MNANTIFFAVLVALTTASSSSIAVSKTTSTTKTPRAATRSSSTNYNYCRATLAFQSSSSSLLLLPFHRAAAARKNEFSRFASTNDINRSDDDNNSSMVEFFNKYNEWQPLFRNVMNSNRRDALASSLLFADIEEKEDNNNVTLINNNGQLQESSMNLWGISTLEQRHPWRLLPSKPSLDTSLHALSNFLDAWQQSLLDIPLDEIITGENDLRFLEEGRRTIAVTRFHVLDEYNADIIIDDYGDSRSNSRGLNDDEEGSRSYYYDWEMELFRTCWSEMAHLMHQDTNDTGSLVLLPDWIDNAGSIGNQNVDDDVVTAAGLEYVQDFVENNLIQPIAWLGQAGNWEIVAMKRGNLAVRLLYKLSDIPNLSKR